MRRFCRSASSIRIFVAGLAFCGMLRAQDLRIIDSKLSSEDQFVVTHSSATSFYYILYRGATVSAISTPVDLALGEESTGQLIDPNSSKSAPQAYYIVRQAPLSQSLDLDGDGLPDVFELQRSAYLNPLFSSDATLD